VGGFKPSLASAQLNLWIIHLVPQSTAAETQFPQTRSLDYSSGSYRSLSSASGYGFTIGSSSRPERSVALSDATRSIAMAGFEDALPSVYGSSEEIADCQSSAATESKHYFNVQDAKKT
jgi:hypothetical protein